MEGVVNDTTPVLLGIIIIKKFIHSQYVHETQLRLIKFNPKKINFFLPMNLDTSQSSENRSVLSPPGLYTEGAGHPFTLMCETQNCKKLICNEG